MEEREVGRLEYPTYPVPKHTHTHTPLLLLRGGSAGSESDDRLEKCRVDECSPHVLQSEFGH